MNHFHTYPNNSIHTIYLDILCAAHAGRSHILIAGVGANKRRLIRYSKYSKNSLKVLQRLHSSQLGKSGSHGELWVEMPSDQEVQLSRPPLCFLHLATQNLRVRCLFHWVGWESLYGKPWRFYSFFTMAVCKLFPTTQDQWIVRSVSSPEDPSWAALSAMWTGAASRSWAPSGTWRRNKTVDLDLSRFLHGW